jgi:hypothetical protein
MLVNPKMLYLLSGTLVALQNWQNNKISLLKSNILLSAV